PTATPSRRIPTLPNVESLNFALHHGDDRRTVGSGDQQYRIYSHRMTWGDETVVLQVARSTRPEQEALGNLLKGLLLGGIAGLVRESDRLSALVDSLLSLARGDQRGEAQGMLFDLGRTVEGAVGSMQPLAAERSVDLTVSTTSLSVRGDPEGIRQIVIILVDN